MLAGSLDVVDPDSARPAARRVARRPVLLGLTAAMTAAPLAGCGSGIPDPLVALAAQARADAALVDSLVGGAGPELAARLTPVAWARRAHADALAAQLGDEAAAAPPSPAIPPDPLAALAGVLAALADSHQRAAAAVPTLPRTQAALVGAIAACCAAYRAVLG